MNKLFCAAAVLLFALPVHAATGQPKLEDTCSITGRANDVRRIELVRLPNGFFGHRAYDGAGRIICYSEWSETRAQNRHAAEVLRAKGDNQAIIADRVQPRE